MTITLGEFPHTCPGSGCAICKWLEEKQAKAAEVQVNLRVTSQVLEKSA